MSRKEYFLIPILLLIIALTFTTCFNKTKDWKNYSSQLFEIKYPPSWEIVTDRNYEIELAPIEEEEVKLAVFASGKISPFSLAGVNDKFMTMIKGKLENIDIIREESITFKDHPGYSTTFTAQDEIGRPFQGQLIVAKADEELLGYFFIAAEDKYEENIRVANDIIATFELQ
ncbi:hypothetical protein [Fuchsiella alkaliacetigena]|uniref:hypothetical protein n=1 Tax=Fuchsiella alkaliacetigena TaxID=957042 RepID=UPI00200AFBC0|nr:hypothetical protein [Fuchsiella alkaliacetigena]MCK8823455.1 hypothetical protein [Fuchsiella alkaliacetigena]